VNQMALLDLQDLEIPTGDTPQFLSCTGMG